MKRLSRFLKLHCGEAFFVCNTIAAGSVSSGIFSGQFNCIDTNVLESVIAGGHNNCVQHTRSFIGGGLDNTVSGTLSAVGGGTCNIITIDHSAISGGYCNIVNATASAIGGGTCNQITVNATTSFIGGGFANCITGSAVYGTIGGGVNNCVMSGANHGGVFAGSHNIVCGTHSAILGGTQNCDNNFSYVGMFGSGLTAAAANTFHVNCINACDTPGPGGSYPAGTFYWQCLSLLPGNAKVLVIV